PSIDHERPEASSRLVPNPIVMHGASSVPAALVERFNRAGGTLADAVGIHPDDVARAVRSGISKVNTDTDLRLALTTSIRETLLATPAELDPRQALGPAPSQVKPDRP